MIGIGIEVYAGVLDAVIGDCNGILIPPTVATPAK